MSLILWTYLLDDSFVPHLVRPVAARHKEPATPALHHPARDHTEQEKFAGAGGALARVTYKEFVARRGRAAATLGAGEEEPLVPLVGAGPVPEVVLAHCNNDGHGESDVVKTQVSRLCLIQGNEKARIASTPYRFGVYPRHQGIY